MMIEFLLWVNRPCKGEANFNVPSHSFAHAHANPAHLGPNRADHLLHVVKSKSEDVNWSFIVPRLHVWLSA